MFLLHSNITLEFSYPAFGWPTLRVRGYRNLVIILILFLFYMRIFFKLKNTRNLTKPGYPKYKAVMFDTDPFGDKKVPCAKYQGVRRAIMELSLIYI